MGKFWDWLTGKNRVTEADIMDMYINTGGGTSNNIETLIKEASADNVEEIVTTTPIIQDTYQEELVAVRTKSKKTTKAKPKAKKNVRRKIR